MQPKRKRIINEKNDTNKKVLQKEEIVAKDK